MKTTKKVLIALLAVALLIPLVIFPASANTPTNLALHPEGVTPGDDVFPRFIAPNSMQGAAPRINNGDTNIEVDNQRWTIHNNANQAADVGGFNGFPRAYTAVNPGADWNQNMNIWFGFDFGTATAFNQVVIHETNVSILGSAAARRVMQEFVVEVANTPGYVPTYERASTAGTEPISENAFTQAGWTEVARSTPNHAHDGFTGFVHTIDFPDQNARYVRVRTIRNTNAAGDNTGMPVSIAQMEVFNTGGGTTNNNNNNNNNNETAAHVAVTNITGVPTTATAGTNRALSPTVVPATATNRTIVWSVVTPGGTGATVNAQGQLVTTGAGTVTVRATIAGGGANATTAYTQDFNIVVSAAGSPSTGEPMVIFAGLAVAVLAVTGMAFVAKKGRSTAV